MSNGSNKFIGDDLEALFNNSDQWSNQVSFNNDV